MGVIPVSPERQEERVAGAWSYRAEVTEPQAKKPQARLAPTQADQPKPPGLLRLLAEDVACVKKRDPAARSLFEVLTIYPGVQALMAHRLAHRLWHWRLRYAARWISFVARAVTNIDIHPAARIGRRFFIDHGAGVVIGETAEIGNDCTLYHGVTLGGTSWAKAKRHPTLGDGVLVGAGAESLGPVILEDGVRVGANAVVVIDVPAGRTVVGIPGRIVQPVPGGKLPEQEIDLNHHLMPDPVGRAIACLLDRIEVLEQRLGEAPCDDCDPVDGVCGAQSFGEGKSPKKL